jgi:alkylation response protein AidB-like acyl-CoA dehydrogenase
MTSVVAGTASSYGPLVGEVDDFMAGAVVPSDSESVDGHMAELVEFQRQLNDAGLAVVSWPAHYGGRDLDAGAAAVVAKRLGELGAPELANFVGIEVLAPAMLRFADKADLARWLPAMAAADELWCQMFSEPDAGSDLAALRTTGHRDGDGWRINGTKIWSTWGHLARWGLALVRTGTTADRHRGITAFVIDMRSEGVQARPLRAMTGRAEFAEVFLDDVFVPAEAVIGEVNKGWEVTLHILGSERGPYAVRRAAVVRAVLDRVLGHASQTRLGPLEREELVRAVTAVRLLDLRIDAVVEELSQGRYPGPEAAITKVLLTRAEQQVMALAHRVHALAGVAWLGAAPPAVGDFLYSVAASIYGGSDQIQHNLIGERLLGLSR